MNKIWKSWKLNVSIPIAGIILIWLIFIFPYIGKGLLPFPTSYLVSFFSPWSTTNGIPVKNNAMPDVITQIVPWKHFTVETWKQGQIPLWNPYSFSGTQHAGNYQTAVFTPFNILFLILPFQTAWSWHVLLQPIFAGVFMLLFLRSIRLSWTSSAFGSVAWMFCGFIVTWMAYATLGYAALFLPLALFGISRDYTKRSWWNLWIIALSLCFSLLSGHFQISIYVMGFAVIYVVFRAWDAKLYGMILRHITAVVIGLLLAAPQLLLSYNAYTLSVRNALFGKTEVIPWQYLITFLIPDFYGNPVTRNDWFGHYAEWSMYIGAIPFIFAMIGIFISRQKQTIFIGIIALLSLLFAYQTPLADLLFALKIPVLSTSAASRILIICSFALTMAAAYGFEFVFFEVKQHASNYLWKISVVISILAGIVWMCIYAVRPFDSIKLTIAIRNSVLPTCLLLSTSIGFFVLWYFRNVRFIKTSIMVFFLLITGFEMYRFASKWMPFDQAAYFYPSMPILSYLSTQDKTNRVFGNFGNEVGSMYDIPLIEGYDAMYQSRYGQFMNTVSHGIVYDGVRSVVQFDKYGENNLTMLRMLGVGTIVHRKSDGRNVWAFPWWQYSDDMKKVYEDEHFEVYSFTKTLPRAYFVSHYEIAQDVQQIADILFGKSFNLENSVVLEQKPKLEPTIGEGTVTIRSYTPQKVIIQTKSYVDKILVFSDPYHAGWKVTIDGKTTELMRANFALRAVAVPSGEHIIIFSFQPIEFRIGLLCMIAGLAILIGGFWFHPYANRHI